MSEIHVDGTRRCDHCGRDGDGATVGAWVSWGGPQGSWLCHPNDAINNRPNVKPYDCYRLVTVYAEEIGSRIE